MKKRNIIPIAILSILFVTSIYLYSLNSNKIKNNKIETESLKVQLKSLKTESQSLKKTNSQLIETNSNISIKVKGLKN